MAVFPSEEWGRALVDQTNANGTFLAAAPDWQGPVIFGILAVEGKSDKTWYFYIDPTGGTLTDFEVLNGPDEKPAQFVISGPYTNWKQIVSGQLDSMQAIIKGKLKVKGNLPLLLKQVAASKALMEEAQQVPTEFIDEP